MSKPSYSELYIDDAQDNLGHAFDFAINSCGIEADISKFTGVMDKYFLNTET